MVSDDEYQRNIDSLTADELQKIDDALLAGSATQYRKVARVVGSAMVLNDEFGKRIPDTFYLSRLQKLVREGKLIGAGNLDRMRYSEVKLPDR